VGERAARALQIGVQQLFRRATLPHQCLIEIPQRSRGDEGKERTKEMQLLVLRTSRTFTTVSRRRQGRSPIQRKQRASLPAGILNRRRPGKRHVDFRPIREMRVGALVAAKFAQPQRPKSHSLFMGHRDSAPAWRPSRFWPIQQQRSIALQHKCP
jgi:hypothetical protein